MKGTEFVIEQIDNNIFSQMQVGKSKNIYLLSKRGYAKLIKIFDDDLSWKMYDKLLMEKLVFLKKKSGANLHQAEDEAAKQAGIGSRRQYYKAKFIAENADEETIKQLDEEQISIHGAYIKLKEEKNKIKNKHPPWTL